LQKILALKPTTVEEARAGGLQIRLLDSGMYRKVFKVKHCDLVIKFPGGLGNIRESIKHSTQEMNRLKRLQKWEIVNRFLPEVFYYDKKSGVIVMRYYRGFSDFEEQADAMGRVIGKLIQRLTRVRCDDVHTENVRQNRDDAVIIDLGF